MLLCRCQHAFSFRYSKLATSAHHGSFNQQQQQEEAAVKLTTKLWRSVKKVAPRLLRRCRKPPAAAGVVRTKKMVTWDSLARLKRKPNTSSLPSPARSRTKKVKVYDICNYSKNFDDGKWQLEDDDFYGSRTFSHRFSRATLSDLETDSD